ncbi:E3 ubiquitin-protein ligase Topors [Drosophila busckii]|uniref:E3 ubiquitin-protein ligase Topors n=1 Tax=Drosophila busckii TaxID=30019 RepID=UPI00083E9D1D|nr:E3 ubiquitin-protein ligase Topors [Drosophila busckii]
MADALLMEESAPPPAFVEDVAASVIVEAAPVAADAVASAATTESNNISLPIQLADLTESGSESGEDATQGEHTERSTAAPRSPPPNCAICLSRCKRKCTTDSCAHQFCFKCLCEWSKIKPECPLCKQPFKTIIHNMRTHGDYDSYPVQSSTAEHSALSVHVINVRRRRFMLQNQMITNDLDAAATDSDGSAHAQPRHAPFNRFEPYRMELLNFYRDDQDADPGAGSLSQLWRRYVYDRKLYALPVSDSMTGNFREWSARFYRDNPAQMHRLMPWINRDIVCLLRNTPQTVSEVMQVMNDILPMINIPTRTFRRHLAPFLGGRTSHFIHELFNFARSPYDMIGYDRVVQYSARVAQEVEVDLLDLVSTNEGAVPLDPQPNASGNPSSNESSSGAGDALWPRPSTSVIVTNPSATHSFSVTMATDGSELPGISIRRTTTSNVGSQTVAINLSMRRPVVNEVIEIDDGDAAANAEVAAINDGNNNTNRRQAGASLPISAHIELQSSDCSNSDDDDECVFVLERKPPHLRTPELVSLDSNSDSDVVFVDEQKPNKASNENNANQQAAGTDEAANAAAESGAASGELFMGPSTSTGLCSTSGKNWKTVLEEARRQELLALNFTARPKRIQTRAQQRAGLSANISRSSSSTTVKWSSSSSSSDSSSSSQSEKRRKKRRVARKPKTRKRQRQTKQEKPAKQQASKRSRRKAPQVEESQEEEEEQQQQQQEQEKASNSSNLPPNNESNNSSSSSSDDDDDDDSTANVKLSALRATLKAEEVLDERKPNKRELADADEQLSTLSATAVKRRRRSSNSNNNTNSNSNLSSQSNSLVSTMSSNDTLGDARPLALMQRHCHDIATSLIELSTFSLLAPERENETSFTHGMQYTDPVQEVMRYMENELNEDAQLGIYSDASNELSSEQPQHEAEAQEDQELDVDGDEEPQLEIDMAPEEEVGEAEASNSSVRTPEIEPAQQDDLDEEDENGDDDDDDEEEEEEENDDADTQTPPPPAADSEASDSD